jgi:hypothetical protein
MIFVSNGIKIIIRLLDRIQILQYFYTLAFNKLERFKSKESAYWYHLEQWIAYLGDFIGVVHLLGVCLKGCYYE